jgi:hypothetical protein
MSHEFSKPFPSPIEVEIQKLQNEYQQALQADVEFHVLKSIKDRIHMLEQRAKEQQKHSNQNAEQQK